MNKNELLLSAAAIGLLAAGPGYAAQVQAQDASQSAGASTVTEVVVTAQHRKENLQKVPIAITVVSGAAVLKSGYTNVNELQYMAPSLQYDPSNGGAFQIRGVGTESYDFSSEQSVSLVVDDVVMDAPQVPGIIGLTDLDHVEVLRGPEGTLFGKNSTSGVLSILTNKPVLDKWSADANGWYGEGSDRHLDLTLNVPLNQKMAFRITGFGSGGDGQGKYTYLHRTMGAYQEAGTRAKLLIKPSDQLEIQVLGDYAYHEDNQGGALVAADPTTMALSAAAGTIIGPNNVDLATDAEMKTVSKTFGGSLQVAYHLGGYTLTSITAFHGTTHRSHQHLDAYPGDMFFPVTTGDIRSNKFSQELRLASPTGQFFEYLAGFYYNRLAVTSNNVQIGNLGFLPPGLFLTPTGTGFPPTSDESITSAVNESKAAFGQVKFNFTSQLSLALGGRYTVDDNFNSLRYAYVNPAPYFLLLGVGGIPSQPSGTAKHYNFSYRIAPQFQITPELMAYFTYSTGYKGPGVAYLQGIYDPYKAETVASYEVGIKSELFDRRLRLNVDGFYERFANFQAQTFVSPPGSLPAYTIGNAGVLRSEGVEVDSNLNITPSLSIGEDLTYAPATFVNYFYPSPFGGVTNYSGDPLTHAPKWSSNSSLNYDGKLFDDYRLLGSISYAWKSKVYTTLGAPYSIVPAVGLLNFHIGVSPGSGAWEVGAYARNLLDTHFNNYYISIPPRVDATAAPESIRTVGVFASYKY